MEWDRNGLEILTRQECLRLLATVHVGRVGLSVNALPLILPVNYSVDGDSIVFRTNPGTKLDAAVAGEVICFETDFVDVDGATGWSVAVQGRAETIELDEARVAAFGLPDWTRQARFVRVRCDVVTGRRLGRVCDEQLQVVQALARVAAARGLYGLGDWLRGKLDGVSWRPVDLIATGDVANFIAAADAAVSAAPTLKFAN